MNEKLGPQEGNKLICWEKKTNEISIGVFHHLRK